MSNNPLFPATETEGSDEVSNPLLKVTEDRGFKEKNILNEAMTHDPEQAAKAVTFGAKTGMPFDFANKNISKVEQQGKADKVNEQLKDAPATKAFMANPDNARVSHDDVDNLNFFEKHVFAPLLPVVETIEEAFERGQITTRRGFVGTALQETGNNEYSRQLKGLDDRMVALGPEPQKGFTSFISEATKILAQQYEAFKAPEAAVLIGGGAGIGATVGAFGGPLAPVTAAAGTIAGGTAGLISFAFKSSSIIEGGNHYADLIEQGIDSQTASDHATWVGILNGAMEIAPVAVIAGPFKNLLKKTIMSNAEKALLRPTIKRAALTFGKTYGAGILAESSTEVLQEITNIISEETAKASVGMESINLTNPTDAEQEELINRLEDIFVKTAKGMALLGPIGPGLNFRSDFILAKNAKKNEQIIEAMGASAKASKVRERLPEKYKEFVERVREQGPVKDIQIPADKFVEYFQSQGIDPRQAAKEISLDIEQQLPEALGIGGDIIIPLQDYQTHVAGTEHHAGLSQDIRLQSGDMTMREAEAFEQTMTEADEELFATLGEQAEVDANEASAFESIKTKVKQQLQDAGQTENVAENQASLSASRAVTRAKRLGRDPLELVEEQPVEIRSEVLERLREKPVDEFDLLIDRARSGRVVSEKEVKGQTLFDFLREKGGVQDVGGELAARDIAAKPGQTGLIQEAGLSFDDAAQAAQEAGFFPEGERTTINELLDAIDRESRGEPVFVEGREDIEAIQAQENVEELNRLLGEAGIDIQTATNEEVRAALGAEIEARPVVKGRDGQAIIDQELFQAPAEFADKSFQPSQVTTQTLPETTTQLLPSKAEAGEYYSATGTELQNYLDTHGDGFLYRVANIKGFKGVGAERTDGGNADYKHRFKDNVPQKVLSLGTSLEGAKIHLEEMLQTSKQSDIVIYRILPEDISNEFAIEIPSFNQGQKRSEAVFVHSPVEPNIHTSAEVVYSSGKFREEALTDDSRRAFRQRRTEDRESRRQELEGRGPSDVGRGREELGRIPGAERRGVELFQAAPAATFFSQLESVITEKMQKKASAQDILNLIKKGNVKAEEIKWSGIEEFLKSKKSVTKDEVLEYLQANRIEVTEVEKGGVTEDEIDIFLDDEAGEGQTREEAREFLEGDEAVETKFSEYTLPGGENYKELLLTLPKPFEAELAPLREQLAKGEITDVEFNDRAVAIKRKFPEADEFISGHFDEPNILAHVRFNERTDADGNKVLFLEEVQSDWALEARKKGIAGEVPQELKDNFTQATKEFEVVRDELYKKYDISPTAVTPWPQLRQKVTNEEDNQLLKLRSERDKFGKEVDTYLQGVPAAPFIQKNWHELALKRMLRYAAENDFDSVAWISGEQTADRYDLSKKVDSINAAKRDDGRYGVQITGKDGNIIHDGIMDNSEMESFIGKDLSKKIQEHKDVNEGFVTRFAGEDLKVGGEWAFTLYDKVIPNFLKKYGKKWGAKVEKIEIEQDLQDLSKDPDVIDFERVTATQQSIPITPEMKEAVLETGQPLFQKQRQDKTRGSIQFTDTETIISLFKNADLSTYLHESGHQYINELAQDAALSDAPQQIKDDFQTLLDFVGAKTAEDLNVSLHGDAAIEKQEILARAFEAYLREGKAPSVELQTAFQNFKAWLISIYRTIKNLNVEVSEELTEVFNRMIATDEEIDIAERQAKYQPVFTTAEAGGMTAAEFNKHKEASQEVTAFAKEDLLKEALKEVTRERRKWWKEERAKTRDQVESEINEMPVYQSIHFLTTGELLVGERPEGLDPVRLSKQMLTSQYGKEILKRLPKGKKAVYTSEDGVHPRVIADLFGFSSGDELIQAMLKAQPRVKAIENETDVRMKQKHGDMLNDGTIEEEAVDSIHNDKRANFIRTELRALSKKTGVPVLPKKIIKDAAKRIISEKRVRDINLGQYRRSEVKAADSAIRAVADGDFVLATEETRKRLLNIELFIEASKAKTEIESTVRYMNKFKKPGTRANIETDYLDQIDAMLERYDFKKATTLREIERRKALAKWITEQEEEGNQVVIDEKLRNESVKRSYKDLPVEELRGLKDAIKNIEHLGRMKERLLVAMEKRNLREVADEVADSILENNKVHEPKLDFAPGILKNFKKGIERFHAAHLKMEFIFEGLDGFKKLGPTWEALFAPIAEAETFEQKKMEGVIKELNKSFDAYTRIERAGWSLQKVFVEEVGQSFNKQAILSLALNWGNEGNREAIKDGYGWTDDQVLTILSNMDKRDWETVQGIWELIDSLWPEIAELQKDLTGVAPDKVERSSFTNEHGEWGGGYYPLKYDPEQSHTAYKRDEKIKSEDLFESNWLRPHTKNGHTIERVGSAGQKVKLDLSVITEHLTNVVHDLAYRRAIIDVDRLSQQPQIKDAIESTAGKEVYRLVRPWLQSIANDFREPAGALEGWLGRARTGATVVNMGLKVTTAIVQPLGFLQSVDLIGEKWAAKGLATFFTHPKRTLNFALERSVMMQNRQKTFDRDVRDALKKTTLKGPLFEVQQSFFYFTGLMDMTVAVPTWMGAYKKGMDEFNNDERKAIQFADQSVRMSQSAGGAKDLAQIQRGSEYHRVFTMFYSYFNVLYNLFNRRVGAEKKAGFSRRSIPKLAASMIYLWFAPAILSELVAQRGPDDEDEYAEWVTKQLAVYPFQTVVGVRDIANAMFTDYGYSLTPAADAFESIAKLGKIPSKLAAGDDIERADVKAALLAAGYWGKLPSRQMWITGQTMYDWATGEDEPEGIVDGVRDLLFARRR